MPATMPATMPGDDASDYAKNVLGLSSKRGLGSGKKLLLFPQVCRRQGVRILIPQGSVVGLDPA